MKLNIERKGDMLGRTGQFALDYPLVPAIPRATVLFAKVNSLKADLTTYGGSQDFGRGGYRAGAGLRRALAKELRTVLVDMAATARSLDPENPGLAEQFRLGTQSKTHQKLLAKAQAFLTAVEPPEVKQLFTDRAYPADFDEQLTAKMTALTTAVGRKATGLQGQMAGTVKLEMLDRDITKTMRELRALMVKHLRDADPTLLSVWNAASRVYSQPVAGGDSASAGGNGGASVPVAAGT